MAQSKTANCIIVSRTNKLKVNLRGFTNLGEGSCEFKFLLGDGTDASIMINSQSQSFLLTLEKLGLSILKNSTIDFDRQLVEHNNVS
jgi:hypothetical protein